MKAVLETRCGCSREINVQPPAPWRIEIPLKGNTSNVQMFEFDGFFELSPKQPKVARYVEVKI